MCALFQAIYFAHLDAGVPNTTVFVAEVDMVARSPWRPIERTGPRDVHVDRWQRLRACSGGIMVWCLPLITATHGV